MKKVVFISGVHGAGKGTLCRKLDDQLGIKSYSASELIKRNSDYIEDSKLVDSTDKNQAALIRGLASIDADRLLLDGHFCLLNKNMEIIELDYGVFDAMSLSLVVFVECEPEELQRRLMARDQSSFSVELLRKFQNSEYRRATRFCLERNIQFIKFISGDDEMNVYSVISEM